MKHATKASGLKPIPTPVKNDALVRAKREELINAAVKLFVRKGYHLTTTREIAHAVGWSIGSLYEYIKTKEDILYLVCESIHGEMESALSESIDEAATGRDALVEAIAGFVRTCDRMQDALLLIYTETGSLQKEVRRYVLDNEFRIARHFEALLERGREDGTLHLDGNGTVHLMAHNMVVAGHMWAFRRWALHKHFTVEAYIGMQTDMLLRELTRGRAAGGER